MQIYLVLALVFSIGVAVFAVQNASIVDINLFFWKLGDISLVVVIFGSALIGAAAAGLFGAVKQFKLRKNLKKYKNQNEEQLQQIEYLENKLLTYKNVEKVDTNENKDTINSDNKSDNNKNDSINA